MSRRRRDHDADAPPREVIVDAAAELFGDKGYHGTSVRDISGQVGILAGSLYSHIESKQELLAEILRRTSVRAHTTLEPLEGAELSVREKLKAVFATYFQIITDSPNEARIMVHDVRSLEPEEQSEARARRNRTQDIVVRIIEQGIASGDFRPVDAKLVAMAIFSVTHWAVEWYHPDGPLDASAAAAVFVDLIVDGMAPRK